MRLPTTKGIKREAKSIGRFFGSEESRETLPYLSAVFTSVGALALTGPGVLFGAAAVTSGALASGMFIRRTGVMQGRYKVSHKRKERKNFLKAAWRDLTE